jgi:CRISPR-associated protein Csy3
MAKKTGAKPSLLTYDRSLSPTDAVMKAVVDGREVPVPVVEKTVLGTQSQFVSPTADTRKLGYGNPQRIESASLPPRSDTLVIEWGLTVLPRSLSPLACDVPAWRVALGDFMRDFAYAGGFTALGHRYATNIANARWAYRNRMFATSAEVAVEASSFHHDHRIPPAKEGFRFDALAVGLSDAESDVEGVRQLGAMIASGLADRFRTVRLRVRGRFEIGAGSSVYPSQEFSQRRDDDGKKGELGKVLFGIPDGGIERCAALHEQKIGNAIRTIDTWHKGLDADGFELIAPGKPLAVNPYGQDRETHGVARVRGSGADLYTLFDKKMLGATEDLRAGRVTDDALFIAANLVRGGVFGMKEQEPEGKDKKNETEG